MTGRYVLGVDPGVTTGLAVLDLRTRAWELAQVTPGLVLRVLPALAPMDQVALVAVEKFVVGPRAGRSSTPQAGQTTRNLVAEVSTLATAMGISVHLRSAAEVKPWATNKRLLAAGPLPATGMPHAADAARHGLFAAVHTGLLPDPLSATYHHRPPR